MLAALQLTRPTVLHACSRPASTVPPALQQQQTLVALTTAVIVLILETAICPVPFPLPGIPRNGPLKDFCDPFRFYPSAPPTTTTVHLDNLDLDLDLDVDVLFKGLISAELLAGNTLHKPHPFKRIPSALSKWATDVGGSSSPTGRAMATSRAAGSACLRPVRRARTVPRLLAPGCRRKSRTFLRYDSCPS